MKNQITRAIISVVLFVAIYFISGLLVKNPSYDMYVQTLKVLASVIGAGSYWIGSNER